MKPQPRYQPGGKIGGRYQVHQALMGGMGEVYLCLDLETIQPYALKTFQQRYLTNPKLRAAFENEVATWVALEKHPNIVRCFHMEILDNQPFMFLEWIASDESRGTDLRSWLQRGPLDLRLALDFTIDICRGLIHAGQKQPGIVHRDLKPDNILVAQGRLAKITDFGLAKIVQEAELEVTDVEREADGRQILLGQGGIAGTPPYMSPEQWHGEDPDVRTDVYALGCILYELLTGRWPFQVGFIPRTWRQKQQWLEAMRERHEHALLPSLPPVWPKDVGEIIHTCLAKRREDRFAGADDLLQQLALVCQQQFGKQPRTSPSSGDFTAEDYNNRGVTYNTLRRYDKALSDLNRAIQFNPTLDLAYVNRGNVYRNLQQYDKALADFSRAIQLDPTNPKAYNNRGVTCANLRRYAEALADYDQAIELEPVLSQAYSNRGFVYESLQQFDRALADYNKAIQLDKNLAEAYVNRSAIYGAMNRLAEALSDIDQAIHLDPSLAQAYTNRANIYVRLNRFDDALADFVRAIELDPDYSPAYYNRAKLHETFQQFDEALSDYSRAIETDPSYTWAYTNRGQVYAILNRYDEALSDFSNAIRTDPNHVLAYTNRGTLYLQLNQYDRAISDFTKAIRIEPTSAGAYTNRGAAYYQMGRVGEALSDLKKAIGLDPANSLAYRNIGVLAYGRGRLQEAVQYFERAVELGDKDAARYIARVKRDSGIISTSQDNLARMIHRLKTDEGSRDLFRSDPVGAVAEYHLTIGEALELLTSKDLPSGTMQDIEARLKLLQFIASYGNSE